MRKPTKTLEEMLRAIIEAQKANGYAYFWCEDDGSGMSHDGTHWCGFSVLEILLDTDGLKAAYPFESSDTCIAVPIDGGDFKILSVVPAWQSISRKILEAWHSGEHGNNLQAAIETAYKFLPPKA